MRDINKLTTRIYQLLEAHKCTNRLGFDEKRMKEYVNTLTAINGLPRYTTQFKGINLSDYKIPKFLSGLILPDSVTLSGAVTDVDFLQRPEVNSEMKVMAVHEFNDMSYSIIGAFRSGDGVVNIERLGVLIQDIKDRGSFNAQVRELADPFFPIPLTVRFISDTLFTKMSDDMVDDALRTSMIQFRNGSSK